MPYVSQEKKKKIADALKALKLPKAWKWTLKVDHRSELVLTIRQAPATVFDDYTGHLNSQGYPIDVREGEKNALEAFIERGEQGVNIYHMDKSFTGKTLKVLQQMLATIKSAGEWFDKSDAMTDYFHTAFYIDIRFGQWNKPCTFVGNRRPAKPVEEPVEHVVATIVDEEPRVGEVEGTNVIAFMPKSTGALPAAEPTDEEKRIIAKAEMIRRYKDAYSATPVGATLNDYALTVLAEAALSVVEA